MEDRQDRQRRCSDRCRAPSPRSWRDGIRIEDPGDVRDGLREALATDGPVLVDVLTDPNALSMPPKITGEQVKGFALAMSRLVLSGDTDEVVNMARSNLRNLPRP